MFKKTQKTLLRKTRVCSIWAKTFLPPHLLAQQGWGSTPDCCPEEHRAPSPASSQLEGFFLEGARLQHFSSCPKLLIADDKSQLNPVERCGLPSSTQAPFVECRFYLGHSSWDYWCPQHSCWLMASWFHGRRGKLGGPQATSLSSPHAHTISIQVLEQKCHSESSLSLSPPLAPEPWLGDYAWKGEADYKTDTS